MAGAGALVEEVVGIAVDTVVVVALVEEGADTVVGIPVAVAVAGSYQRTNRFCLTQH